LTQVRTLCLSISETNVRTSSSELKARYCSVAQRTRHRLQPTHQSHLLQLLLWVGMPAGMQ
jgi:hypothetical protein